MTDLSWEALRTYGQSLGAMGAGRFAEGHICLQDSDGIRQSQLYPALVLVDDGGALRFVSPHRLTTFPPAQRTLVFVEENGTAHRADLGTVEVALFGLQPLPPTTP
jgi:hypothetical protein